MKAGFYKIERKNIKNRPLAVGIYKIYEMEFQAGGALVALTLQEIRSTNEI